MVLKLWNEIKKQQFAPTYLLYGTEPYLINETKQLLMEHALHVSEHDFNLSVYDLEETPVEVAIEDAETLPFMGERRLIFMNNPVFLTTAKPKEKIEHNLERLEAYVKNPAPYSIIVLAGSYEKLDERKKITKVLKKYGKTLEANKLTEEELFSWVKEKTEKSGIHIDDSAIEVFLRRTGTNLFLINSELEKLILYAGKEKRITVEMVESLTSRSLEQNIFELIDKIVHRQIDEALRIYYDLLKQNEEPIKILSLLADQFRLIYQVKELARRGYGQKQIAGYLKVHPYRVKLAAGQARLFRDDELVKILRLLANADYQAKTGAMNKEMLIEMFLFRLNEKAI